MRDPDGEKSGSIASGSATRDPDGGRFETLMKEASQILTKPFVHSWLFLNRAPAS